MPKPVVLLICLFLVITGCQTAVDQPVVTRVVEKNKILKIIVIEGCTLVGCGNGLSIDLISQEPVDEFIIEMRPPGEPARIMHCFDRSLGLEAPFGRRANTLDHVVVEKARAFSTAPDLCSDVFPSGTLTIRQWQDGILYGISLTCPAPAGAQAQLDTLCDISTDKRRLSVTFENATPAEADLIIHWNGKVGTIKATPTYHIFQPNGPACEPTCKQGTVTYALP